MAWFVNIAVATTAFALFVLLPSSQACQNCIGGQCDSENECTRCHDGYYGKTCEITCSPHCGRPYSYILLPDERRNARPCNKTSGQCEYGCDNEDKVIRYYYDNCTVCINGNCDNPHECGTKKCTRCQRGYYGDECRRSCKEYCYTYKDCRGPNCNEDEPMCGRHDGSCSFGCINGVGYCPASKAQGYEVNGLFESRSPHNSVHCAFIWKQR